jgi:hypothetical protein
VVAASAAIIVLFLVLNDDSDEGEPATGAPTTELTTGTQDEGGEPAKEKPKPEPEAKPEPEVAVTEIQVKGGQPVGGVQEISIPSGEKAEIVVSSPDTTDHVHLHGYDVFSDLAPGKPATIGFDATIDGVFEMELEDSVVPIAEVTVSNRG